MTGRRPLRRSAAGAIVAILAALVLAADQLVKYLTIQHLPSEKAVPVLGEFLQLFYIRNSGAAFSIGAGMTWIFTIALAVVAVVIVWKTLGVRSRLWAVVLGCLLGGERDGLGDTEDGGQQEPDEPHRHAAPPLHGPRRPPAGSWCSGRDVGVGAAIGSSTQSRRARYRSRSRGRPEGATGVRARPARP